MFEVPQVITTGEISWKDRIFNTCDTGFTDSPAPLIQEIRVELWDSEGNVLAEIWSTNPGDPDFQEGPNNYSFENDLSIFGTR